MSDPSRCLVFPVAEVRKLVAHSMAAAKWRVLYAHLDDRSLWLPGTTPDEFGAANHDQIDASKITPYIALAKDHGAYIMSGANPGLMTPDGESQVVVYAAGCNPKTDPDYYDTATDVCGGDDFVEALECSTLVKLGANDKSATALIVEFSDTSMKLSVDHRPAARGRKKSG